MRNTDQTKTDQPEEKSDGKNYQWKFATPARAGATDHENVPSRRHDGLHKHKPMMLMASKVRGGESAR
jgi:hypothetical protein